MMSGHWSEDRMTKIINRTFGARLVLQLLPRKTSQVLSNSELPFPATHFRRINPITSASRMSLLNTAITSGRPCV